jgi:hypothetical protein
LTYKLSPVGDQPVTNNKIEQYDNKIASIAIHVH